MHAKYRNLNKKLELQNTLSFISKILMPTKICQMRVIIIICQAYFRILLLDAVRIVTFKKEAKLAIFRIFRGGRLEHLFRAMDRVGLTFNGEQSLKMIIIQIRVTKPKQQSSLMIPTHINPYYNTLTFNLAYPHIYSALPHALPFISVNFAQDDLDLNKTQVKLEQQESKPIIKVQEDQPHKPIKSQVELVNGSVESGSRGEKGKKQFKKDRRCPVHKCPRKYSSRIALRAHMRRQHPSWYQETSQYEP